MKWRLAAVCGALAMGAAACGSATAAPTSTTATTARRPTTTTTLAMPLAATRTPTSLQTCDQVILAWTNWVLTATAKDGASAVNPSGTLQFYADEAARTLTKASFRDYGAAVREVSDSLGTQHIKGGSVSINEISARIQAACTSLGDALAVPLPA